jgi:quinol monooxygenase YgiN
MATTESCYLEIEFTLKPGKRREFARSVEDQIGQEGDGHIKTTIYEDWEEPGHMIWMASWTTRAALEAYMLSQEFGVLIGGLKVLSTRASCSIVERGQPPAAIAAAPSERTAAVARITAIDLESKEGRE